MPLIWRFALVVSTIIDDGVRVQTERNCPYLSLVVVTKHDTNPGLFNTKFRLNFHSRADHVAIPFADHIEDNNIITIGRSSSCNMILDYRTVSTIHARITYEVRVCVVVYNVNLYSDV